MSGSALLARVRAAYRQVPAVELVHVPFRYTFVLRHGVVTAEELHGDLGKPDLSIARRNGAYGKFQARCWIHDTLTFADPGHDLGSRFPSHIADSQVETAHLSGGVWKLPVVENGGTDMLLVDAKTLLINSLVFYGAAHDVEYYNALPHAPTFPSPRPLCHK